MNGMISPVELPAVKDMGHPIQFHSPTLSIPPKSMASKISKSQQSFSETEKSNQNHPEVEDEQALACPISSQLHLKPSVHSMDKDVILKRIRHRKRSNKVKNAFQTLATFTSSQRKWLDPDDAFSSS
ncbi:hypothetical protein SADUNF_Sadunf07G0031700 [Salix dunnii]|uniref:Uncharacterized protein n=1 Tax=Salix dunnii TaxID=1413687 RepID=A0A835K2V2_9ROSI|nr:hypothetical protein SADUNF_Sadunf07G0031700 [Salix dunnii]